MTVLLLLSVPYPGAVEAPKSNLPPAKLTAFHARVTSCVQLFSQRVAIFPLTLADGNAETYVLYTTICAIPPAFITWQVVVNDITRSSCRRLCSTVYADTCSGFLFSRRNRSCILTPYAGNASLQCSQEEAFAQGFEFFRRQRQLGQLQQWTT